MTAEQLKTALENPKRLVKDNLLDKDECLNLARALMTECWIRKGTQHYWITDLEFYIYTDNHRDIITYPRECPAGTWFFHDSGVDIAFESKVGGYGTHSRNKKCLPILTEDSIFGGILIRGIEPEEPLQLPEGAIVKLDGPKKACFHLFDQFSAIAQDDSIPRLEPSTVKKEIVMPEPIAREGFPETAEDKVKSILSNYSASYLTQEELIPEYRQYFGAKYHYTLYSK